MWLEEKTFGGNNTVHFSKQEFTKYKQLEEILLSCQAGVNSMIAQTAEDILGLLIDSEYLLIETPEGTKQEVKLPLTKRDYVNPLFFEESEEKENPLYTSDFDVDISDNDLDFFSRLKPKYFKAVTTQFEALTESGTDDISEIFEIGFIYLNGIINMAKEIPIFIKILNKKRELTRKTLSVNAVLPTVIARGQSLREYEANLTKSIIEIIGCGSFDKIPTYSGKVSYEEKAIEERKKEKH